MTNDESETSKVWKMVARPQRHLFPAQCLVELLQLAQDMLEFLRIEQSHSPRADVASFGEGQK